MFTQYLIVNVKGGFVYGTEHEICRESANRPIFFSFYLPDPLPFYFSIPLSLSFSFSSVCSATLFPLPSQPLFSLRDTPVDTDTGGARSTRQRVLNGVQKWWRGAGDDAKKKKKTLLDLVSLYSLYTSVSVCLSVSWSPLFVHPVSRFPTMGNASSDADVSNITCALHFSSVSRILLICPLHFPVYNNVAKSIQHYFYRRYICWHYSSKVLLKIMLSVF